MEHNSKPKSINVGTYKTNKPIGSVRKSLLSDYVVVVFKHHEFFARTLAETNKQIQEDQFSGLPQLNYFLVDHTFNVRGRKLIGWWLKTTDKGEETLESLPAER